MAVKVIINGAHGKMGVVTQQTIADQPDLQLVATLGKKDNLANAITNTQADVVVDFTLPHCVFENTQTIINTGARPVVGTSGLSLDQINQLKKQCADHKTGGIIAPNFSLSAILMMRYAKDAAKYFNHAEIIEMHHEQKVDAPSGTAVKTAQLMTEAANALKPINHDAPARGEAHCEIPIHSVRLPGYFAHQMVIFGGKGETLTIRQDSTDRTSMMPGVFLACREVMALDHMIYGLENIL